MKPRRHPYFSEPSPMAEHKCDRYCKVHYYWDFASDRHEPLPTTYNILTSSFGWLNAPVFVGPPGYYPRKPTQAQMTNMEAYCPHTQGGLACGYCLHHTFHPYEV